MAITVAPLTTVVMNSVDRDRIGVASGINNAVARVAGVLTVAVLGIVMVSAFRERLDRSLAQLSVPLPILEEIHRQETKLAGLQVSADLDPPTSTTIRASIQGAFVFAFRVVVLICAGLSVASAGVACWMIPKARDP